MSILLYTLRPMINNFNRANSLLVAGEYAAALEFYKEAEGECTAFSPLHFNVSRCYEKLGDFLSARVAFIQACIYSSGNSTGFPLPYWWSRKSSSISENTVAIFVPVFNARETIRECVASIFSQSHDDIVVVAVDDASTDDSAFVLNDLKRSYKNFHFIKNSKNCGPFGSVNVALLAASEEDFGYFIKHDADDVMLPKKLESQLHALKMASGKMLCTTGYTRVLKSNGQPISGKNRGHNMTVYKKAVFQELGYFDSTRFGGDSEYLERALTKYGVDSEVNIPERLTKAYYDGTNITAANPLGSSIRVAYQDYYRWLHKKNKIANNWFLTADRTKLKVSLKNEIDVSDQNKIICGMATIALRKDAVSDAINSILPQVDKLIVYQNGFKDEFGVFSNEKIIVISSLDTGIDMGDAGKYYKVLDFHPCYYFSCDDDLIYPPDYIEKMIASLKSFGNKAIVTCHGRLMEKQPKSYYKHKRKVFHFKDAIGRGNFVHFGGTGVMGFHTDTVNFGFNMFRSPNMADIWVGLYARERGIPVAICPHPDKWIHHSDKFDVETTIFRSKESGPTLQDKLVQDIDFSEVFVFSDNTAVAMQVDALIGGKNIKTVEKKKIVVGIPTFNRHGYLQKLVSQLDKAAGNFDVELIIRDDGSFPPVSLDNFDCMFIKKIHLTSSVNQGKKRYWVTVNSLLEQMGAAPADYYFYLSDDIEVGENFFEQAVKYWEMIEDEKKISLNFLNDGREECWTKFKRVKVNFAELECYKAQWLDMLMMFDAEFLKYRVNEVPLSRWKNNPNISSGVGAQLSTRFHEAGYSMYQLKDSLIFHGDHESKMNPEERMLNPLISH